MPGSATELNGKRLLNKGEEMKKLIAILLLAFTSGCLPVIVVLVVSLKQTQAFRSVSFIAIVAVIANGPIEIRRDESWKT